MRGMLGPSALKSRFTKAPRPAWKVAEAFCAWLRKRPCACEGRNPECRGPVRSAHVDGAGKGTRDAKGMSTKAADRFCIPLTDPCHQLQHTKGWPWFIANMLRGRDPIQLSEAYWKAWPGRAKWEAQNDR